jgi:hypothetical protein
MEDRWTLPRPGQQLGDDTVRVDESRQGCLGMLLVSLVRPELDRVRDPA